MAWIGQAYDLKTVSKDMISKRVKRTGDGTWKGNHKIQTDEEDHHHHHSDGVWGWGDKDMKIDDIQDVRVYNNLKED